MRFHEIEETFEGDTYVLEYERTEPYGIATYRDFYKYNEGQYGWERSEIDKASLKDSYAFSAMWNSILEPKDCD
jgi:hypothetical protein